MLRHAFLLLLLSNLLYSISAFPQGLASSGLLNKASYQFVENKGQVTDQHGQLRPDVKYLYTAPGIKLIFKENSFSYELYTIEKQEKISEATGQPALNRMPEKFELPGPVTLHTQRVDVSMPGACLHPQIVAEGKSHEYFNFYLANTPEDGIRDVYSYAKLTYKDVWKGVDLVFYARKGGELKYDIVLHAGARVSDVQFVYAGMRGLKMEDGRLKITTAMGEIEESVPLSYLPENGKPLTAAAKLSGNSISYASPGWNGRQTLVIDPVLKFGLIYGGTVNDICRGIVTDASGNFYITGITQSNFLATSGAYQTVFAGGFEVFLARFNSSGSRQWATYYGGYLNDAGNGITMDRSGNIIITGYTQNTNVFASSGAYQTSFGGVEDAFIAKFNSSGSRIWGTFYGGSDAEEGYGVTTDSAGNIFVVGVTFSDTGIATSGAHQTSWGGYSDAFLVKFSSSGKRQWGSYYGDAGVDGGYGIVTDKKGNVYVTGYTNSPSGMASSGAFQTSNGGYFDAFVARFSNSSGSMQWGTYYGGSAYDKGYAITTDISGDIIVTGWSGSTSGIASANAYQTANAGNNDAFIVKFNNAGSRQWGTYYGGDYDEGGQGIITDGTGNIIVTGETYSSNGIASSNAYQKTYGGKADMFLVKLNSGGSRQWGTYYGDAALNESGQRIALDTSGDIYITADHYFNGGASDVLLLKFYDRPYSDVALRTLPGLPSAICAGDSFPLRVALENISTDNDSNIRLKAIIQGPSNFSLTDLFDTLSGKKTDTLSFSKKIRLSTEGTYNIAVYRYPKDNNSSNDTIRKTITVYPRVNVFFSATNACAGNNITFIDSSTTTGTVSARLWKFGDGTTSTSKSPVKSYAAAGTFTVKLITTTSNGCKDSASKQITVYPKPIVDFSFTSTCAGNSIALKNNTTISSGSITDWSWNFGDGTTSNVKDPAKSYSTAGFYTITLTTTTDHGCINMTYKRVTIYALPDSQFTVTKIQARDYSFIPKDTLQFMYRWYFGDGDSSVLVKPKHAYKANGNYTVRMWIQDRNGCVSTSSQKITVNTGIEESSSDEHEIRLYPNPFRNSFILENAGKGQSILEVYNLTGERILLTTIKGFRQEIDLSGIATGMYLVRVSGQESVITGRIFKE